MSLDDDLHEMRERWYADGVYSSAPLIDTLKECVERHAKTSMHFYTTEGVRHASVELAWRESEKLAAGLQQIGLQPGDVVAVQMPTLPETQLVYLALIRAGLVVLPIVTIYGAAELQFVLKEANAKAIVVPDVWRNTDFVSRFQESGVDPARCRLIVHGPNTPPGAVALASLMHSDRKFKAIPRDPDEVCLILFTSGTTSHPKGVLHSYNGLRMELLDFKFGSSLHIIQGPFLNVYPAGHIGGLLYLLKPFVQGVETVFLDQWDPDLAVRLIEDYRIEHTGGPQYFLTTMLQSAEKGGANISSLRLFAMGAAGISPASIEMLEKLGLPGGRGYGSTEVPTATYWTLDMPLEKRAYTDGKVCPLTEVRIVDDAGNDVPKASAGEIVLRSPEMMLRYLRDEDNMEAFLPGGWFRSGDVGTLDDQGFLTITDRKKDIIIRGGENISSKEVEDVVAAVDGVLEVAAVAKADAKYGERVCIFVVLKQGVELDLATLQRHFIAVGVARQKTPEVLRIVTEMPRTPAGKIKKFELRKRLLDV